MVHGEQKAEDRQGLDHDGGVELPGSGGLFMLFQQGLLLCQLLRGGLEGHFLFSQWEATSFELQFRR